MQKTPGGEGRVLLGQVFGDFGQNWPILVRFGQVGQNLADWVQVFWPDLGKMVDFSVIFENFDSHPDILTKNGQKCRISAFLAIFGSKIARFHPGFWLLRNQGGTFFLFILGSFSSGKMNPGWGSAISFGNCDREAIQAPSGPDPPQGAFS